MCVFVLTMYLQVNQYYIHCAASLGDLITMEMHTKKFICENDWFCDKISVMTPEGDTHLFPMYRWLDDKTRVFLRPATGMSVCYRVATLFCWDFKTLQEP